MDGSGTWAEVSLAADGRDTAGCVALADDTIIVGGTTTSFGAGQENGWILVFNHQGQLLTRSVSLEPLEDDYMALVAADGGRVVVAGKKRPFNGDPLDHHAGRNWGYAFEPGTVGFVRELASKQVTAERPLGESGRNIATIRKHWCLKPDWWAQRCQDQWPKGEYRIVGGSVIRLSSGFDQYQETTFSDAVVVHGLASVPGGHVGVGYTVSRK